jgi:nucleotide-binding universal stress UspA family protein
MKTHLLVVTDGTDNSLGALRLARALLQKHGGTVDVLAVLPSLPDPAPSAIDGAPSAPPNAEVALQGMHAIALWQLTALGKRVAAWPLRARLGHRAETIARTAAEVGASLIVVGRTPGDRTDAELDAEATLEVVHLARLPVLAVPKAVTDLPRRVLVGVDLHDGALDAAAALLLQVADPKTIHLAHVAWEVGPSARGEREEWKEAYLARVAAYVERLAAELRLSTQATVEVHVPVGEWDMELLDLSDTLEVDLIVTGSHGYGELGRAFTRSVSAAVVHRAECSVLVAPTTAALRPPEGAEHEAAAPLEDAPLS